MKELSFFIPERLVRIESQNRSTYGHWTAYRRYRDQWLAAIRTRINPKDPPDHRMRVKIVSQRMRILDHANLVGGAKPIPDVLQRLGYIKDDSPDWVDIIYRQCKASPDERGTMITISDGPA